MAAGLTVLLCYKKYYTSVVSQNEAKDGMKLRASNRVRSLDTRNQEMNRVTVISVFMFEVIKWLVKLTRISEKQCSLSRSVARCDRVQSYQLQNRMPIKKLQNQLVNTPANSSLYIFYCERKPNKNNYTWAIFSLKVGREAFVSLM